MGGQLTEYLQENGFERLEKVPWHHDIFRTLEEDLAEHPTFVGERNGRKYVFRIKPKNNFDYRYYFAETKVGNQRKDMGNISMAIDNACTTDLDYMGMGSFAGFISGFIPGLSTGGAAVFLGPALGIPAGMIVGNLYSMIKVEHLESKFIQNLEKGQDALYKLVETFSPEALSEDYYEQNQGK